MSDILTITLNPAVDYASSVERVVAGEKLYCRPARIDPGGGGVNVARTILRFGGRATALVAVGGAMGDRLLSLLTAEGVEVRAVSLPGETRYSLAVTDETTGEQFRFSLAGEPRTEAEGLQLLAEIAAATSKQSFVVLSGGVAPGLSDDFPQQIQAAIAAKTDRLIVDTSKAPLAHLVTAPGRPVHLLRLDRKEAAMAAGHPMRSIEDSLAFASGLVARGVARMVVTGQGADGSIMATETARYFCTAPKVQVLSRIGAGDALVGALTWSLARGDPPQEALRWGVAAASATVETEGTALCTFDHAVALMEQCETSTV